jgi:hypothetical protein
MLTKSERLFRRAVAPLISELRPRLRPQEIVVRIRLLAAIIATNAGCASIDAPRHGARDYAAMSCNELVGEAKDAWRRKHVAADRQAAKQDLKAIKTAAIAKSCALPG